MMAPLVYTNHTNGARVDFCRSLQDFLDACSPDVMRRINADAWLHGNTDLRWAGGLNYAQAWEQCRIGMNVERSTFELRERLIQRQRIAKRPEAFWDVSGSDIDMGSHLSGVPESMLNYREEVGRTRKTVSLLLSVTASASVRPEQLRLRGAAYMALIDALELSGQFRTNVYAVTAQQPCFSDGSDRHETVVCLKDSGHQYDPHAVGFALGHPGFLRQLLFGFWDTVIAQDHRYAPVIGHNAARGMPCEMQSLVPEIDAGAVDITKNVGNIFNSEADAHEWIAQQLEVFNVLEEAGIN